MFDSCSQLALRHKGSCEYRYRIVYRIIKDDKGDVHMWVWGNRKNGWAPKKGWRCEWSKIYNILELWFVWKDVISYKITENNSTTNVLFYFQRMSARVEALQQKWSILWNGFLLHLSTCPHTSIINYNWSSRSENSTSSVLFAIFKVIGLSRFPLAVGRSERCFIQE